MLRLKSCFVFVLLLLTGQVLASPEFVSESFIRAAAAGDTATAESFVYMQNTEAGVLTTLPIAKIVDVMVQKAQAVSASKGGLTSIKTSQVTYIEEGKRARAQIQLEFADGTRDSDSLRLVNIQGQWKVEI
ncbi:DUF4878 domain-containing protein [Pseudomonas sp. F1_0610]|uniref:DUF4878 domain-containing protein n=1 Tax=Pseudomonas sp. F1_0610 TaxID=3114284 RepID=UPI0039C13C20